MSAASNGTITTGSSDPPPTSSTPSSISSIISSDTPSSTPPPTTSSTPTPTSSSSLPPTTSTITTSVPPTQSQVTQVVTVTSVESPASKQSSSQTTTASSATTTAANIPSGNDNSSGSGGLSPAGRTAIAVVVPVVAVALLVLAGLFLWRRRKQRKNAEEARRKEVEDYGYNPNNDPTLPAVGGVAGSEMMEDSSGYRGWGNMTNASNRKTSTTVSAGHTAVSDSGSNPGGYRSPGSPTQGASDGGHSVDPLLMGVHRRATGDADGIGALGAAPTAGANRSDIRRGPSNASSSYSAGNRSESSDGQIPVGSPQELYSENAYYQPGPYGDGPYGGPQQPVIRDVQARRNTRIENPSVFPHQGNSGIAQNF